MQLRASNCLESWRVLHNVGKEIRYVDTARQAKMDGKINIMMLCLANRKRVLQKEMEQTKRSL